MILFPAIDLKDGQCVRLKLGDMASATVYNENPAAQAKAFEDQAKWGMPGKDDWQQTIGMSANDPVFDGMIRLGCEYRESQRPRPRRKSNSGA